MKVKVPVILLILMAAAIGYLLGTESGRTRRDELLVRFRGTADDLEDAVADAADEVSGAVEDVAEAAEAATTSS